MMHTCFALIIDLAIVPQVKYISLTTANGDL